MAVRNAEGSFYICKAMQNIFMGSKNIKIQWLSNEDSVIPAKDNPDGDIYAHDFYDKTGEVGKYCLKIILNFSSSEFETILTSVELEKTLGKSIVSKISYLYVQILSPHMQANCQYSTDT